MTKANLFLASSWVGLAGLIVAFIAAMTDLSPMIRTTGAAIAVFAGWVMLFTRNADEYTRALWTAAASLAFATVLILYIGLPFIEGFMDGLDNVEAQDIPATATIAIAIGAFYAGLFSKRLRGDI